MKTLDDAWNRQDWETFMKRHAENVAVYWPGQAEPTRGREAHHKEAMEFFKTFDNSLVNNPFADWTVVMKGTMKAADGRIIQPTNKMAKMEFCTVAHWKDGEIVEEKLFYDLMGVMQQLGSK